MKEVQEAYVVAALRSEQTVTRTLTSTVNPTLKNPGPRNIKPPPQVHITGLAQLEAAVEGGAADVVLWHDTDLSPREPPAFKPLADYMMIWHEWYDVFHNLRSHDQTPRHDNITLASN